MFAYLLLRSTKAYQNGQVSWKGRNYDVSPAHKNVPAGMHTAKPIPKLGSHKLRTEN
jgi:hypothetical protein